MKKIFYLITVIIVLLTGRELYYYRELDRRSESPSQEISFTIETGESARSIAYNLKNNNLIASAWAFKRYLVGEGLDRKIMPGVHTLSPTLSIREIARELTRRESGQIVVQILEGWTIQQTDEYLSGTINLLDAGEFIKCARSCKFDYEFLEDKPAGASLEGYLFPDTYFFDPRGISARDVIEKMLDNMDQKFTATMRRDSGNWHQVITMASLIEKETRESAERAVVSGILWKRVREGIRLGVDASIRYALDKWDKALTKSDLNLDSPYNTYKNYRLPPTPISGFSLSALRAAVYPEASPYYYYLHGRDGQIRYATTLDQHNENIWKYLR